MVYDLRVCPTDGTPLKDSSRYWHIVGSLVYPTVTLPNIAHAIHILRQFVCAPTSVHFGHLLHLLWCLCGTSSQFLLYAQDSQLQLHAYSDPTWTSDPTNHRSDTGYCILLGSSHAWKSKKQVVESCSSTEAELRELLTLLLRRSYGFDGCWLILVFLVMLPHLFYVTTQEPSKSPIIL